MRRAFIGLGSNLGDRRGQLRRAVAALRRAGLAVRRMSSLYQSQPVGVEDQPEFLNAVVEVATDASPEELLQLLKRLERQLGRRPRARWGPREVDLDLLWFEGEVRSGADLQLPHPRAAERAFVLLPWSELAPDLEAWPGRRVGDLAAGLDGSGCRRREEP